MNHEERPGPSPETGGTIAHAPAEVADEGAGAVETRTTDPPAPPGPDAAEDIAPIDAAPSATADGEPEPGDAEVGPDAQPGPSDDDLAEEHEAVCDEDAVAHEATGSGGEHDELEAEPFLEEHELPPAAPADAMRLSSGETIGWGELRIEVTDPLDYGWYRGVLDGEPVLIRSGPSPLAGLRQHRALPRIHYAGPEGVVAAAVEGTRLAPPLALADAAAVASNLAQLANFLAAHGLALIDLDPDQLVPAEQGVRLGLPPRVARLAEDAPPTFREGFTAPELVSGRPPSNTASAYLIAAVLHYLLVGRPLPPEGLGLVALAAFDVPGLPQLFARCLDPDPAARPASGSLLNALLQLAAGSDADAVLPTIDVAAATTVGLNPDRHVNEDSYAFSQAVVETALGRHARLRACVADGMGGQEAGEVASRAAATAFVQTTPDGAETEPMDVVEWTERLAWEANAAVLTALEGRNGGCTFTGIVAQADRVTLAHVGDSRAYLVNDGGIERLTRDHSLVGALLANGEITEEEARRSPDRGKILRSLGSLRTYQQHYVDRLTATRDRATLALRPGDTIVLCTDGVCGEVDDDRIAAIVAEARGPREIAAALIRAALDAGAPDNATAVVLVRR